MSSRFAGHVRSPQAARHQTPTRQPSTYHYYTPCWRTKDRFTGQDVADEITAFTAETSKHVGAQESGVDLKRVKELLRAHGVIPFCDNRLSNPPYRRHPCQLWTRRHAKPSLQTRIIRAFVHELRLPAMNDRGTVTGDDALSETWRDTLTLGVRARHVSPVWRCLRHSAILHSPCRRYVINAILNERGIRQESTSAYVEPSGTIPPHWHSTVQFCGSARA